MTAARESTAEAGANWVETDVLVIGGGMAGVTALLSAIEHGASAALVERNEALGGSTVLSSGLVAFAGTDEQTATGVTDSVEALRSDLLETGRHRNSEALVDAYCDEQLATYRWLSGHGVVFGHPHAASGQSAARSHPIDTSAAIGALSRAATSAGALIHYGVQAERLVVEGARVVGVTALVDGKPVELRARSVVLTTGGFSRNEALLARFAPGMEHALRGGAAGCRGDGLLMACKLGAALVDLPYIKGTFGIFPWRSASEWGTGIMAIYKGAVAVNGFGRRFIDESLPYKEIGDACLAQPEGIAFQIFDAKVLASADPAVAIYDFGRRVEGGQVQQADTVAALADKLGMPGDVLEATIGEYNRRIAAGEPDELGRRTMAGSVGEPALIDTPPYYGFPSTTVVLATYAGIAIDPGGRVLDVYDEPIAGLYAAGELTGGFHGAGYVTGSSIGKAAVFGRICGRSAALDTPETSGQAGLSSRSIASRG